MRLRSEEALNLKKLWNRSQEASDLVEGYDETVKLERESLLRKVGAGVDRINTSTLSDKFNGTD